MGASGAAQQKPARRIVRFAGRVADCEVFRRPFGPGFTFELARERDARGRCIGWSIAIGQVGRTPAPLDRIRRFGRGTVDIATSELRGSGTDAELRSVTFRATLSWPANYRPKAG